MLEYYELRDESNSPRYKPGDIAIIDRDFDPIPGDMVFAFVAGRDEHQYSIGKYVPCDEAQFEISPINPAYPSFSTRDCVIQIVAPIVEWHMSEKRERPPRKK
ncbi:S24 family peptidase [Rhodomicrobium lacus]|uniref:S24 family peptidase n=1 Tax=Rhodomicrobium lacus TaxID=2498452 RepID=UPI000F8F7DF8|nr:S24 family peptidase [Rhodomicrobium lacus]